MTNEQEEEYIMDTYGDIYIDKFTIL
jgi:hypothetical protein